MEKRILEIINEIRSHNGLKAVETINPETDLRKDLDLSSFDLAELTVTIEDEFGVDIFENGLINTVGEIYAQLK